MKDLLLCLVGPTASDKTATGIALAERLGGEIVSADSRQVYRRLDIGTAKATAAERARVPHHLVDVVEPDEPFHAGRFIEEAEAAIADIRRRRRVPIVVGGTGLYVRALVRGLDPPVGRHDAIREELERRAAREGCGALHDELARIDPDAAEAIHRNDRVRIVRALEIYRATGKTRSEHYRRGRRRRRPCLLAGLRLDRALLYRRIDARFDRMIDAGLVGEVRRLLASGIDPRLPALAAPGYRELVVFAQGKTTLAEAIEKAKRASRRYAKRQMTWFRAEAVRWFDPLEEGGAEGTAERIAAWYAREKGKEREGDTPRP